jgi:hypothetical protein
MWVNFEVAEMGPAGYRERVRKYKIQRENGSHVSYEDAVLGEAVNRQRYPRMGCEVHCLITVYRKALWAL